MGLSGLQRWQTKVVKHVAFSISQRVISSTSRLADRSGGGPRELICFIERPRRQPQDHVAVALARPAQEAQPVDHKWRQPNVALPIGVNTRFVRYRPGGSVAAMASNAPWVQAAPPSTPAP